MVEIVSRAVRGRYVVRASVIEGVMIRFLVPESKKELKSFAFDSLPDYAIVLSDDYVILECEI